MKLCDHIATVVARAKSSGEIIVCEKLDFAKKKSALRESAPKGLRVILSSFAYKKFFTLLQSRCSRESVYLKSVNPAAATASVSAFARKLQFL